jgi:hypothetical protein
MSGLTVQRPTDSDARMCPISQGHWTVPPIKDQSKTSDEMKDCSTKLGRAILLTAQEICRTPSSLPELVPDLVPELVPDLVPHA